MVGNAVTNHQRTLVVITGQLRNGADNLDNWLQTAFDDDLIDFLYYVWDDVGLVDSSKIHLKCLRTRTTRGRKKVEVSSDNKYLYLKRSLDSEINEISRILGQRVTTIIEPYRSEYMTKAGDLEVNELIQQENHPWWQGSAPLAYINHLAYRHILENNLHTKYDRFFRVQSEVVFDYDFDYRSLFAAVKPGQLLTSPNAINPQTQVSVKFFGGDFQGFGIIMDAYTPLIEEYKTYRSGIPPQQRPIGERFLKQLAQRRSIETIYGTPLKTSREQVIPICPVWQNAESVDHHWGKPTLIQLDRQSFNELVGIFRREPRGSVVDRIFRWFRA